MIGSDEGAFCLDKLWLSFILRVLVILFLVLWILFSRDVQDSKETILIGEQYFLEVMIVNGMNCLFVSFVVTIQLEWFQSRVFI